MINGHIPLKKVRFLTFLYNKADSESTAGAGCRTAWMWFYTLLYIGLNSIRLCNSGGYSWMENDRRLCRNYEWTFYSGEEMAKISAIKLLGKKI